MSVFRCDSRRACVLVLLGVSSLIVQPDVAAALTLREAIERTSKASPTLTGFSFQSQAAREYARAREPGPPPALEVQLENFAGSGATRAADALEATLQLSKVLETGGKREARSELGAAEISDVDATQQSARADLLAEVARRFIHVLSDQQQLEVTHRATALAEQARDAVRRRVEEGAISTAFLNRAEIALARARIAQEHAEHELAASRVSLAVLWGDTSASFSPAEGDLFAFAELEPLDSYVAKLAANPDLLKFVSEQRLLAARHRLAQAQRRPNVTLTAGVRRLEAIDEQALVAGFSVPIGTARRAAPEINAVRAERERLVYTRQARELELRSVLFSLYQEVLHAHTESSTLREQVRPQAEQMVRSLTDGYRAGRYSLVELIEAQKELIDVEQQSIRAAAEFHTHLIEIERVTGVAVHTFAGR